MAADGLHLFMDAIRSKESKKAEKVNPSIDNLKLLELIQLFSLAVNPNRTEAEETRYVEIRTSLAPPDEDKERLARHFCSKQFYTMMP